MVVYFFPPPCLFLEDVGARGMRRRGKSLVLAAAILKLRRSAWAGAGVASPEEEEEEEAPFRVQSLGEEAAGSCCAVLKEPQVWACFVGSSGVKAQLPAALAHRPRRSCSSAAPNRVVGAGNC